MSNGKWGSEERSGGLPIAKGQLFEIIFLVDSTCYKVAVNGRHFTEFKHRIPFDQVRNLVIKGDYTTINFIKYEGGSMPAPPPYSPPGYPGYPEKAPAPYSPGGFHPPSGAAGDQLYNPPVPLTHFIPGGMQPGRMIHISGVPHPDADRFTINLKSGPSDHADVNFHFDVRKINAGCQSVVVRNHKSAGTWGPEEREASYFPFVRNSAFDLIILADPVCFKVAVNNQHFIQFPHRLPLQNATVLNITGDVKVTSLRFQ
nr:hypothetical protein BaRGS_029101 [Batillaria attramentaria]